MSGENIYQVYQANPITSNASTDLLYVGSNASGGGGTDAAITYGNFSLQFGAPYTAAALTRANDTNVTLTLGGTPSTALLEATSLTLGWTGQLSLARGGTNANLTASNGGIFYSTASAGAILAGTATASLPLLSGSSAAPIWGAFALSLGGTLTTAGALTTSGAFGSTFTFTNTTSVIFPTSGTLATTSQLPTPTALTSGNDTNVTLTLGGTPSTALLQAASITAGWTGQLSLARGGTNANLTASNGGIFYSTGSAGAILAGTATANQILMSGASTTPAWSTATYPATAGTQYNVLQSTGTNVTSATLTSVIDGAIGSTQGNILYRNASGWVVLAPGTAGFVLQTGGASANPSWVTTPGAPYSNIVISSSNSGTYSTSSTSSTAVTNLTVSITTKGGPVRLSLQSGTANASLIQTANTGISYFAFYRGVTQLNLDGLGVVGAVAPGAISYTDTPTGGTYTYTLQVYNGTAAQTLYVEYVYLVAMEI